MIRSTLLLCLLLSGCRHRQERCDLIPQRGLYDEALRQYHADAEYFEARRAAYLLSQPRQ